MQVVAITRWGRGPGEPYRDAPSVSVNAPPEAELHALASLLDLAVYDVRLRLRAPLPVVLTRRGDPAEAARLVAVLRSRGHGAVVCPPPTEPFRAHEVVFDDERVSFRRGHRAMDVAYTDVELLLQAEAAASRRSVSAPLHSTLVEAAVRPVYSPAPAREPMVTTGDVREHLLFVTVRALPGPVLLGSSRLRHDGLGVVSRTTHDGFSAAVAALRARCAGATFDDRLTARSQKADRERSFAMGTETVTLTSNERAVTLAAWLVLHAHRERQL